MKSKASEGLLDFFCELESGSITQKAINNVVETAVKIAVSYLRMNYTRTHKIQLQSDLSVEDIAIDSVADLFTRNDENRFCVLKRAFDD